MVDISDNNPLTMNIAIDVTSLQASQKTGLWSYTQSVVEALSNLDNQNQYFLIAMGLRVKPSQIKLDISQNFKKCVLPVPDRNFVGKKFLWNQLALPIFSSLKNISVFYQPTGHNLPSWGTFKKIITIHDLRSLYIKDFLPQDIAGMRGACKVADAIVAISEFTKQDVIEHLQADPKKVFVIYNGVSEIGRIDDVELVTQKKKRFNLTKPFIFSLGMVPRKNIKRLIYAYASSNKLKEDFLLVLAGAHGGFLQDYENLVHKLGIEKNLRFFPYLTDEDLGFFYSNAELFVFPSLFEGFGLPVLEAQRCGCPVVCSNTSALPEVVGGSAVLVNPFEVEDIKKAMELVLYDQKLKKELVEKGYENVKRFSWQKSASELLRLFRL